MDNIDAYDSAEDSDYNPENDPTAPKDDTESGNKRKRKPATKLTGGRSRGGRSSGGIFLEDEDDAQLPKTDSTQTAFELAETKRLAEKKKEEELDAMFAAEFGVPAPAKAKSAPPKHSGNATTKKQKKGPLAFKMPGSAATRKVATPSANAKAAEKGSETKLVVSKTYDFAGEKVVVTKEVAATSREAKAFVDAQAKEKSRSGALGSILTQMGKKSSMNTVAKTQLDWKQFKDTQAGLAEELQIHNKDGYLEKVAFLERADAREHELSLEEKSAKRRT
eukprot:m.75032 g.75032  ORF g.75032 m.75032 type:complete len:278 (-) comp24728_c0_seq1:117-950(-)